MTGRKNTVESKVSALRGLTGVKLHNAIIIADYSLRKCGYLPKKKREKLLFWMKKAKKDEGRYRKLFELADKLLLWRIVG